MTGEFAMFARTWAVHITLVVEDLYQRMKDSCQSKNAHFFVHMFGLSLHDKAAESS